jgi:hypothetical protein
MHKPTRLLTDHRRARLIAWALAMLAWIASVLFAERAPSRRHIRQRYALISLHPLARFVCKLAAIRAVELAGLRKRQRSVRNAAPAGFRRRIILRPPMRAIVGARLRKAFNRGDLHARIQFLRAALSDIDAFARRHLVPRALRRLTKLCAIVMTVPRADAILGPPAPSPACADSS